MRRKIGITSCRMGIAAMVGAVGFLAGAGPFAPIGTGPAGPGGGTAASSALPPQSVARQWTEQMLTAIRLDFARPTVHARNLYHVSVAMWDAWAAYDENADGVMFTEFVSVNPFLLEGERREAISFAAYRVLKARFASSPGADTSLPGFDALMDALGYDKDYKGTLGDDPAAVGNRIAITVLFNGFNDGANEAGNYENTVYEPVNPPLLPDFTGNPDLIDPNRWQPLALEWFMDQGGNIILEGYPDALGPEWGQVVPFALKPADVTLYQRDDFDYLVCHDPGPPPLLNGVGDEYYRWGAEQVAIWSSHLDPSDGVMWDISPASIGNAVLPDPSQYEAFYDRINGGDWGTGYTVNPATGQPYAQQLVPRGDYTRILAEFWADGPDSETPPGHWFVILNYVSDHPDTVKQLGGTGPVLDDLEWDVKAYLAMSGGMHDVAVACWGTKGWYDYIRPISAIRYMSDQGQSSDPKGPSYHPDGIRLVPGLIEVITAESSAANERHEHLAGDIGEIALYSWRGPTYINDPDTDTADVGWILAGDWWPYQRPSFVTPPFPGYTSGHSTYSRAAALIMTAFTGDDYFPGGLGEFFCPQDEFLVFEDGPSVNVTLQWARYLDASDQCSLSRIWGGIHPGADDIPGRIMGEIIGPDSYCEATRYYNGQFGCPADIDGDGIVGINDFLEVLSKWDSADCNADIDRNETVGIDDFLGVLGAWGPCP